MYRWVIDKTIWGLDDQCHFKTQYLDILEFKSYADNHHKMSISPIWRHKEWIEVLEREATIQR